MAVQLREAAACRMCLTLLLLAAAEGTGTGDTGDTGDTVTGTAGTISASAVEQVEHPRLYFSASDLPHLRAKAERPFMAGVLQQYADALNHTLNYSKAGHMQDVADGDGGTMRLDLAASLYVAGVGPNTSAWCDMAKHAILQKLQVPAGGGFNGDWFANEERTVELLVQSYDVTADCFSAAEAAAVEASFAAVCERLMVICPANRSATDLATTCFNLGDMASRLMNPSADRLGVLGLVALTFPNQPNASRWLAHAIGEFRWMVANGIMEDGQWHEPSTRYHAGVLRALIPFSYALRHAGIMDPFNDLPLFKKYVGWYRLVQTPRDKTMGGCALTPALSDADWETVWEATLGWAAGAFAQSDPAYATELWVAWERACAPMGLEPSPSNQLASFLFVGCLHADECGPFVAPFFAARVPQVSPRESVLLAGYAVLRQPASAREPWFLMSTSTQRQTEGHEHPDRGSFSLYHEGVPLVLDPGDGWCGYNWFGKSPLADNVSAFDSNLTFGAWYRGSQSHSMVNFAQEGPDIKPENETFRPRGGYGHQWGLRGPAWMDTHLFSDALDFVSLNVTRAVQASQLPGVQGYHRRVFANRHDGSYLMWDAVNAPLAECSQAIYNLHVVTQLGWPGKVGCAVVSKKAHSGTCLECAALDGLALDVSVLRPAAAVERGLLAIEADPLPVQFTGVTGVPNGQLGGAFGGDWGTATGVPPPHTDQGAWKPRTPTWIRLHAAERRRPDKSKGTGARVAPDCAGFLTLLQPRKNSDASLRIGRFEELPSAASTVEVVGNLSSTLYLLGSRPSVAGKEQLQGLAAVVGSRGREDNLTHVELLQGSALVVPRSSLRIVTSAKVTLSLRALAVDQYELRVHGSAGPTIIEADLPFRTPPEQVTVWRGAHAWHVGDSSSGRIRFEALPDLVYLIESRCLWSLDAGYGQGGWLCLDAPTPTKDEI
eukprot:SAG22_NODE_42_length_25431_cov_5.091580_5_plen_945_part_00